MKRFRGVNFEARDYSSIVCSFSPQNHKLIGRCRAAISNLRPARVAAANRIKWLGSLRTCRTARLTARSATPPCPKRRPPPRLSPRRHATSPGSRAGPAPRPFHDAHASGIYTPPRPTIMPGSYAGPSASLPSSRGPGHSPLKASTPVRIRLGAPFNHWVTGSLNLTDPKFCTVSR